MIFNSTSNIKNRKYVIIYVDDMLCNEIVSFKYKLVIGGANVNFKIES